MFRLNAVWCLHIASRWSMQRNIAENPLPPLLKVRYRLSDIGRKKKTLVRRPHIQCLPPCMCEELSNARGTFPPTSVGKRKRNNFFFCPPYNKLPEHSVASWYHHYICWIDSSKHACNILCLIWDWGWTVTLHVAVRWAPHTENNVLPVMHRNFVLTQEYCAFLMWFPCFLVSFFFKDTKTHRKSTIFLC